MFEGQTQTARARGSRRVIARVLCESFAVFAALTHVCLASFLRPLDVLDLPSLLPPPVLSSPQAC